MLYKNFKRIGPSQVFFKGDFLNRLFLETVPAEYNPGKCLKSYIRVRMKMNLCEKYGMVLTPQTPHGQEITEQEASVPTPAPQSC